MQFDLTLWLQFLARAFETKGFSVFLYRLLKRFHGIALVVQQVLPSQNTEKHPSQRLHGDISDLADMSFCHTSHLFETKSHGVAPYIVAMSSHPYLILCLV